MRLSEDAVECLHDLTTVYLNGDREASLQQLLDQADRPFRPAWHRRQHGTVLQSARQAVPPARPPARPVVRGLANKLRQHRTGEGDRGAGVLSLLFSQGPWEPALCATPSSRWRRFPTGSVDSTHGQRTGDDSLVRSPLGRSGQQHWRACSRLRRRLHGDSDPVEDRTTKLTTYRDPVVSIAYSMHGDQVILVRQGEGQQNLAAYEVHSEAWISTLTRPLPALSGEPCRLTGIVRGNDGTAVGLYTPRSCRILSSIYFDPGPSLHFKDAVVNAFLVPSGDSWKCAGAASEQQRLGLSLYRGLVAASGAA